VRLLNRFFGFFSGSLAGVFDGREIFFIAWSARGSGSAAEYGTVPGGNMQNEFPNAVSVGDRLASGLGGGDSAKELKHGVTVPGFAFKGAADLVGETSSFRHCCTSV
jgi:hypothetical protein